MMMFNGDNTNGKGGGNERRVRLLNTLAALEEQLLIMTPDWRILFDAAAVARARLESFRERLGDAIVDAPSKSVIGVLALLAVLAACVLDALLIRSPLEFFIAGAVGGTTAEVLAWILPAVIAVMEIYIGWRAADAAQARRERATRERELAAVTPVGVARGERGVSAWEVLAILAAFGVPAGLAYTFILTNDQLLWGFLAFFLVIAIVAHAGTVLGAGLLVDTAKWVSARRHDGALQRGHADTEVSLGAVRTRARQAVSRIIRIQNMWLPEDGPVPRITDFPDETRAMVRDAYGRPIVGPPSGEAGAPTPAGPPAPPRNRDDADDDLIALARAAESAGNRDETIPVSMPDESTSTGAHGAPDPGDLEDALDQAEHMRRLLAAQRRQQDNQL